MFCWPPDFAHAFARAVRWLLGSLALAALLAGCGGGASPSPVDEHAHAAQALAQLRAPPRQRTVIGVKLTLDATALMDWAQASYPTLFPGSPATTSAPGFVYRFYPATQTFVAVTSGNDVYVLGPLTDASLLRLGSLGDFECLVFPSNCTTLTQAQRQSAAQATAQSGSNACAPVRPFYWEIGDGGGALASGSVGNAGDAPYTANSQMSIASASKWLYAAYVAQRRAGAMTAQDIQFLNFRSGYVGMNVTDGCDRGQTVDQCLTSGTHGDYTAADANKFYYAGGHITLVQNRL
jgi:hypothetical protein